MKRGNDIATRFDGFYLVHQNLPSKEVKDNSYKEHILFLPLQGEISVSIANLRRAIGSGHMLYLPPNVQHSFASSTHGGERLIVMIDVSIWSRLGGPKADAKVLPIDSLIKEILFYLLLNSKVKHTKSLIQVFIETLSEALQSKKMNASSLEHIESKIEDDRVKRAVNHIREHYAAPLNMNGVAEAVGLSSRNLNRLMVKETGLQPKQLLILQRVEKAKELLRRKNTAVTDAAFAVGYNSLSQFISAFRTHTGQLPSEYARMNGGKP